MLQKNPDTQNILQLNQASGAAESLNTPEVAPTPNFFSEAVQEVLANTAPANAGELVDKLGIISKEELTKLLEQMYKQPIVQEAVQLYQELFAGREDLSFHGGVHGFDIALKGLVIAMQEEVVPTDQVTALTTGIFISLLFHDSGITILNEYDRHEAASIRMISHIMIEQEKDEKIPLEHIYKIWPAIIAIYGTKIIMHEGQIESMSAKDRIDFRMNLLEDMDAVEPMVRDQVIRPVFSKAILEMRIMNLFTGEEFYELVRQLSLIYCAADTIGVVADNSTEGTIAVAQEVDNLNAKMRIPKLEPRVYIGRIEGLINICRSAVAKLSNFPQELLSDETLQPWYKRAARLKEFVSQPHITSENATAEFKKAWPGIKAELAETQDTATPPASPT